MAVDPILHPAELRRVDGGPRPLERRRLSNARRSKPRNASNKGHNPSLDMHPSSSSLLLRLTLSMATCLSEVFLCPLSSPCWCARVRGNSGKPPSAPRVWASLVQGCPDSPEVLGTPRQMRSHDQRRPSSAFCMNRPLLYLS